jgi:hypothetical protein
MLEFAVVVPWVREEQRDAWLAAWGVRRIPPWLLLQRDATRAGCGATKNAGVRRAMDLEAGVVVVLDDDCFPTIDFLSADTMRPLKDSLELFARAHVRCLEPARVRLFQVVTDPPSRGTPYGDLTMRLPTAASLGFWEEIGDYCAVRQLATGAPEMRFKAEPAFWRWFPLSGMNVAFRPEAWFPWCQFIEVPRFDDIWMGWLWQREAYRRGHCFRLDGPRVRHARQSNVWQNLREEATHLQANETLWQDIIASPYGDYESLRALLP